MPDTHIYVKESDYDILKKLAKGEVSKIFSKALREHFSTTEDLEKIKKEIILLEEESKMRDAKLQYLKKRFNELSDKEDGKKLIEEQDREKQEKDAIEYQKKRQERLINWLADLIKEHFVLEEEIAIEESKGYFEYQAQCKANGLPEIKWVEYIQNRGFPLIKQLKKNIIVDRDDKA